MKTLVLLMALLLLVPAVGAQSPRARGGINGAVDALSSQLEREIAADAEIELAKAKAAIELDKQRKLMEMEASRRRPVVQSDPDAEMNRLHPQWAKIVTSNVFNSWLDSRSKEYRTICLKTNMAVVLASCIDSFFDAKASSFE